MSAAQIREKLARLLADRKDLGVEMDLAAAGKMDRETAERFRRRIEHFEMWIASLRNELSKVEGGDD